jgi:hypothetical protein
MLPHVNNGQPSQLKWWLSMHPKTYADLKAASGGAPEMPALDPRAYNLYRAAYSLTEILEIVPLGRTSLHKAINSGQLKAVKYGRKKTLILAADLAAFLARLQSGRWIPPSRVGGSLSRRAETQANRRPAERASRLAAGPANYQAAAQGPNR